MLIDVLDADGIQKLEPAPPLPMALPVLSPPLPPP
jgi:hypothetical protein